MGFRFRRSLKILPGLRLNISKSGLGVSAGVKGFRVSVGPSGVRQTVSIPGTGISFVDHKAMPSRTVATSKPKKNGIDEPVYIPPNDRIVEPADIPEAKGKSSSSKLLLVSLIGVAGVFFLGGMSLIGSFIFSLFPSEPTINVNDVVSTSYAQYTQQAIVNQMFQEITNTAAAKEMEMGLTITAQVTPTLIDTIQPSTIPVTPTPPQSTLPPVPTPIPVQYLEPAQELLVEPAVPQVQPTRQSPYCCKYCDTGKACGDSCIAADRQCHQPPGCACD